MWLTRELSGKGDQKYCSKLLPRTYRAEVKGNNELIGRVTRTAINGAQPDSSFLRNVSVPAPSFLLRDHLNRV